jgi:hypothetical protein
MADLKDEVLKVVLGFVAVGDMFTALDVSNKVKQTLPFARHREVRDEVRALFTDELEPQGWAKTPISVTLDDGSKAEALLYHSLVDSWDLDSKYDAQKRAQTSARPVSLAQQAAGVPATVPAPLPPVMRPTPMPKIVPATPTATVVAPSPNARDAWNQLFGSKPSLFPRQ